ncbi:GntR family transcriptional regulator [Streptomyces sp. NPDC058953]|uniref:GntR family transcriptional regulator n=1 Tax=unclassified Streptomyces TaxID=2593676 RepID=UPI0036C4096F
MEPLAYRTAVDDLRRRIADGEYAPGDVLPAESGQVLAALAADGLVVPAPGGGFTLAPVPLARPAGGRRAGTNRHSGGRRYRILGTPETRLPPTRVADALGLPARTTALCRGRLLLDGNGTPLTYVTAWFPPDVTARCPRLTVAVPIPEGTTHYIRRETGRTPARGTDTTTVRLATEAEADRLLLERPAAVAVVLHTAYDREQRPLVCEEGVTPAAHWGSTENYVMDAGG